MQDRLALAATCYRQGLQKNASIRERIKSLERAVKLDPYASLSFYHLGRLKHRTGLFVEAIDAYETACRLNPGSVRYLFHLGMAYLDADDHPGLSPVEVLEPISALDSKEAGQTVGRVSALDHATVVFKKILGRQPDHTAAAFAEVEVLLRRGKYSEAGSALESIEYRTDRVGLFCEQYLQLLFTLTKEDELRLLLAAIDRKVGIEARSHPAYHLIELVRDARLPAASTDGTHSSALIRPSESGELPQRVGAAADVLVAIALSDRLNRGDAGLDAGIKRLETWELLTSAFERWSQLRFGHLTALHNLATEQYKGGQYVVAAALWREALVMDATNPRIIQNLAILYTRIKDEEGFLAFWDRLSRTWALYGELFPEAQGFEKQMLMKYSAFATGIAKRMTAEETPPSGLVSLWIRETASYLCMTQLSFEDVYLRCGVSEDADDADVDEAAETMRTMIREVTAWEGLSTGSRLLARRLARLEEAAHALGTPETREAHSRPRDVPERDTFESFQERRLSFILGLYQFCMVLGKGGLKKRKADYIRAARQCLVFPLRALQSAFVDKKVVVPDVAVAEVFRNNLVRPLLEPANAYIKIKSWKEAVPLLDDVLQVDPKSALALYYRGLSLAKQGRLEEAERDCRAAKASVTDPELRAVIEEILTDIPGVAISDHMNAAVDHINHGNWSLAVTELDAVLQIHSRCFDAYKYKALCLTEMEDTKDEAFGSVALSKKVPWEDVEATVNAGLAHCRVEDTTVRKDLEEWRSTLLEKRLSFYLNPAIQAINKGLWTRALACLEVGKAQHPNEPRFPQYQAICHLRSTDYKRATLCANEALKISVGPDMRGEIKNLLEAIKRSALQPFIAAAEKHLKKKRWSEAAAQMDKALVQYPRDALCLYYKALCCLRLGDQDKAGTVAEQALLHTDDQNLRSALTNLSKAVEREKAIALFNDARQTFLELMSKVNGAFYSPHTFEFQLIEAKLESAKSHSIETDVTSAIQNLSKNVSDIMKELEKMGRLNGYNGLGSFKL